MFPWGEDWLNPGDVPDGCSAGWKLKIFLAVSFTASRPCAPTRSFSLEELCISTSARMNSACHIQQANKTHHH
jgi:hypothetical protein